MWEAPLKGKNEQANTTTSNSTSSTTSTTNSMVDPFMKEKMTQALMLERFGEENPGFDFRDAEFNGQAPDPRTFMGGINYK